MNPLIISQHNINSLKSKFSGVINLIKHIDILVLTKTKLDESYPKSQFLIEGYSPPFRQDRNLNGGGVMMYIREDIPCKVLHKHNALDHLVGIFLELNLRKSKWLLFGGYNPHKDSISNFVNTLEPILDTYLPSYDNFLIFGDFNSEKTEKIMKEFCDTYNLKNLIKDPTCYKSLSNPSSIDMMLTSRPRRFFNSTTIESGLSEFHKLRVSVLKLFFQKQTPISVKYRDYKNLDLMKFRTELIESLSIADRMGINYTVFEDLFITILQ